MTSKRMRRFTRLHTLFALLGLVLTLTSPVAAAQAPTGSIGFSLEVSGDGIFNPKVVKALVKAVEPGSQAQSAGLAVGDELIRVDGVRVPGAEATVLKPHMNFSTGKPKTLAFRRADGTEYEATLVKR